MQKHYTHIDSQSSVLKEQCVGFFNVLQIFYLSKDCEE